ncbi:branched-chain amino acid ABC transporter permease [Frigidibacter albus]|uniref:Branched-chain amino acid ABC transporter permease n=1 Tax=Frigidibacter albus TaxID=1465486 RepID=A0A6L8VMV2_9RHOB|nr:branched-chain amino acid ABC transporter permease [Frigidibacter albus]MZQ91126.1 branched-chain amino acid ABC transporter permease [Frigidibacter albus]NBE33063.1 branched-chain amino acid ABC transporter permease [Frigidibacter albus]GGH62928.1 branched-chain amino acid ABC transporter permease [Frigidibacter albus]
MTELFGVPLAVLAGQVMIGLINGSFYALLSLGLAIIFGLLNVINFAHGAYYMVGAFVSWGLLTYAGIGYWPSLVLTPLIVGAFGALFERTMLRRLYGFDHLFSLLLTFGLALALEGMFRWIYGAGGKSYAVPPSLTGVYNLGFMVLPIYRAWVIVASLTVCVGTWLVIEKTSLGARLRAATENPSLVTAFGINVPLILTLTYAAGVGLAGLAGAMAAPIYQVSPNMGSSLIIIVFAVVVIGGMGSIMGSILTGLMLGVLEGLTKVFFPTASALTVFIVMILVLLLRPAGLFGKDK